MPRIKDYFRFSPEEVLAVISTNWQTLHQIRAALQLKYNLNRDNEIIDASLYISLNNLEINGLIERSENVKKKVIYKLADSTGKSAPDSATVTALA